MKQTITRRLYSIIICAIFVTLVFAKGEIKQVPFTDVQITDLFWKQRLDVMRRTTIRYAFQKCADAGQLRNFEYAGRIVSGEAQVGDLTFQSGNPYDDAEVYKVLEGASYLLTVQKDAELEKYCDGVVDLICSAQEPDGYLQTNFTIHNPLHPWYEGEKWKMDWNLSHETFNVGELVEAAIAYYQATGKDKLLNCAMRAADNMLSVFNEDGIHMAPGHAVVEMALVRLYELTGEERYLNGCKFFLDCRGVRKFDPTSADQRVNGKYWQDHLPAIQQRTAEGHAVRAMYFYSGMADWVRYSADKDYETAVTSIWNNIANCKFYITGGFGARDNNEAFGENYELPNATAYCETCASVAGSMFNLRMFRLHGEGKYIDMMERALYNTVLDGYGIEGKTFYYPNRLASSSRGDSRSEWFGTSCCPTNLCRLIPSVPGYIYATSDDELYWNLFVASDAHVTIGNTSTDISVTGQYPYKGSMRLTMNSINGDNPRFTLKVRIPGWTGDHPVEGDLYRYVNAMTEPVTICINGEEQTITTQSDGYAILEREWKEGDYVDVNLPMDVRQVLSNDLLTSNQGLCAYERGPIVYCAEGEDNNGLLDKVYIPLNATTSTATAPYSLSVNFRGGIQQIKANGYVCNSQDAETTESEQLIRLIPYHARASRTACQMKVWIPYDPLKAEGVINFLDEVKICDESSEKAHNLQGTNMRSGSDLGWRDAVGGWISYDMLVKPDKPMDFIAKHWGSDGGNRKFKILCDGEEFSYDHIDNFKPGEYYYMRHPIPYELTKGKQKVTITMKAESNDDLVGGIYGAYTALSENTPVETTPMDHMWTSQESSVTAHAYSSNGGSGFFRGRTWLDGSGTIGQSWNMQVNSTNRNYLMLLYWGEESDMRIFDIYCDNVFVASESLCLNDPGRFIMRCYPIPEESTSGKNKIRIRITSPSGTKTGGIFYAYMMSTNGENTSVRPIMPNIPEETCYDLQGIKRESPISGINLISSPDGLRKVFMQ